MLNDIIPALVYLLSEKVASSQTPRRNYIPADKLRSSTPWRMFLNSFYSRKRLKKIFAAE